MPPENTSPDSGGETDGAEFTTPPTTAENQPIVDHVMSGTGNHEEVTTSLDSLDSEKEKPSPTTVVSFDSKTKMAEQDSDESSPAPATNGAAVAPSPSKRNSVQDDKDLAFLTDFISMISPEVAQKALRDNWRTFLFKPNNKGEGPDDHHLSFILRAAFKNASSSVIDRVVRTADFFRPELVGAARYVFPKLTYLASWPIRFFAACGT
jgi:hypothetical protein